MLVLAPRSIDPWFVAPAAEKVTVVVGPGVSGVAVPVGSLAQLLFRAPSDAPQMPALPLRPPSQYSAGRAVTTVGVTWTAVPVWVMV